MNKVFLFFLAVTLFLLTSSAHAEIWNESVTFNDLSDQRTVISDTYNPPYSQGGLVGYWPGFSISWYITYNLTSMLWTYEYTLLSTKKDVSHFILELSEGTTQDDLMNIFINDKQATIGNEIEGPNFWGKHPSTHGYPASPDIYGIKFDVGGNPVKYSFTTANDPVWGNFYAKSGKNKGKWVYVYNSALEIDGFNSENKLDFIARPDGGDAVPVIPEPLSSILFLTGGAALAFRRYLKERIRLPRRIRWGG